MGKFAGFLKRAKRLAGIGSGILGTVNNLYKSVKPAVDTVVGLLPGGGVINNVLSGASKGIDMIQPYTNEWITDTDRKTFNSMNKTANQIGSFLNDIVPWNTVGNIVADKTSSIFGDPVN